MWRHPSSSSPSVSPAASLMLPVSPLVLCLTFFFVPPPPPQRFCVCFSFFSVFVLCAVSRQGALQRLPLNVYKVSLKNYYMQKKIYFSISEWHKPLKPFTLFLTNLCHTSLSFKKDSCVFLLCGCRRWGESLLTVLLSQPLRQWTTFTYKLYVGSLKAVRSRNNKFTEEVDRGAWSHCFLHYGIPIVWYWKCQQTHFRDSFDENSWVVRGLPDTSHCLSHSWISWNLCFVTVNNHILSDGKHQQNKQMWWRTLDSEGQQRQNTSHYCSWN